MKLLTCNGMPVVASKDEKKLIKEKERQISLIKEDWHNEIINESDSEIVYHDGIRYHTDEYEIVELEII